MWYHICPKQTNNRINIYQQNIEYRLCWHTKGWNSIFRAIQNGKSALNSYSYCIDKTEKITTSTTIDYYVFGYHSLLYIMYIIHVQLLSVWSVLLH